MISTAVIVKLDDTNYLTWHFQMQILLESHGILGFVDGSRKCPSRFDADSDLKGDEIDDYQVWKMHDRALMQLLIAILSFTTISYVIGCVVAHDMWIQLKDRFSTITKERNFQMKSELQNIKKGSEPVSHYLHKIKDARDHLFAAGVSFEDDDIVILAFNGLPLDYNTFRCMIRGRDNTLSLKDFRSQLLAEEATLEQTQSASPFVSAMLAQNQTFQGKALVLDEGSSTYSNLQPQGYSSSSKSFPSSHPSSGFSGGFNGHHGVFHGSTGGFNGPNAMFTKGGYSNNRGFYFKGRGRSRGHYQPGPRPYQVPSSSPGIFGPVIDIPICQICSKKGHVVADCYQRHNQLSSSTSSVQCQICWKFGHSAIQYYHRGNFSYQGRPPSTNLSAMHANFPSFTSTEQFLVYDTRATTHKTSDLAQLNLATPFSRSYTIATADGSGLSISNVGFSILDVP